MQKFILYYIISINIVAFFIYALDKHKAIKDYSRISERTLLSLAFLGGFVGAFISMVTFRHKVSKTSFMLKYYAIVFLWIGWLCFYFLYLNPINFMDSSPL